MNKYKNLLINVGIFGLSAVATKLMAFILMPLYTLYLSTEEYGIMDMATIMVTTLFPVLTLLISEGMLRFTLDDKSKAAFYITEPCWLCWQAVCFWQLFCQYLICLFLVG